MKSFFLLGTLLAAILAAGCEMIANSDHSQVTVTDGNVSSFHTRQGNVLVDLNTAPLQGTNVP